MSALAIQLERQDEHRAMFRALLASVLLHIVIAFIIAWALTTRSNFFVRTIAPVVPEEITITMVDARPVPQDRRRFADSNPAQEIATPDANATFESDRNTRAATQEAAQGTLPLPTQQGIETSDISIRNQQYSEGEQRTAETAAPQPAVQEQQPEPVVEPSESQLAMLQPKTTTAPAPREATQPQSRAIPRDEGYQPEKRVTRITGGIGSAGPSAVATASTPLGRYRQQLSDAIGKKWYAHVKREISLLNPGTAEIRFIVLPSGRIEKIQVLHNTSNRSFEVISSKAISEAIIPPIPEDLVPALEGNRIEVDFTFTILER